MSTRGRRQPTTAQVVITFAGIILSVFAALAVIVSAFAWIFPSAPSGPVVTAVATTTVPATTATADPTPTAPTQATTVAAPVAAVPAAPARTFVVCIDAGHQGRGNDDLEPVGPGNPERKSKVSDGAQGVATRVEESKVNLDVALKLEPILTQQGVKVVMVRRSQDVDISNVQRAKMANEAHADLTVRLHCDGAESSSRTGVSIQLPDKARYMENPGIVEPSRKAGSFIREAVIGATGAKDLGMNPRTDLSGFNWSAVPTVVVEMGFLSNPDEDRRLNSADYQDKLAQGVADGVMAYLRSLD